MGSEAVPEALVDRRAQEPTGTDSGLTNATAEGINRILRMVNNRASGFRSAEAFIDLIYLTAGDVDIPAQIPARFRTL